MNALNKLGFSKIDFTTLATNANKLADCFKRLNSQLRKVLNFSGMSRKRRLKIMRRMARHKPCEQQV